MRSPLLPAAFFAGASLALTVLSVPAAAFTNPPPIQAGVDGVDPNSDLTLGTDGNFYGTAGEGGAEGFGSIFQYDPHGNGDPVVLHSFTTAKDDGIGPEGVIEGADGNYYGITGAGGTAGVGTIYTITSGGKYTHLYSFPTGDTTGGIFPSGLLVEYGNNLFAGVTAFATGNSADAQTGTIYTFSINPGTATSPPSLAAPPRFYSFGAPQGVGSNGAVPDSGLVLGPNNLLYGTTSEGGLLNFGTVYSFDPLSGVVKDLHDFAGYTDGANPNSPLLYADGVLYGTAFQGGRATDTSGSPYSGDGTIFSMDASGAYQVLHDFHGTDGENPTNTIALGPDGDLWLAMPAGGKYNEGVIVDFNGTSVQCASFRGLPSKDDDGAIPAGGLTLSSNGLFYGLTAFGGRHSRAIGDGILYSFDPAIMQHTIIHYFGKQLHLHPAGH